MLSDQIETEIAALAARYGAPRRVEATLAGAPFDPLTMDDRYGEVHAVRRTDGTLISARRAFPPRRGVPAAYRRRAPRRADRPGALREVAEETGLEVAVRRFLAVIEYAMPARRRAGSPPSRFCSTRSAACWPWNDPAERIAGFRASWPLLTAQADAGAPARTIPTPRSAGRGATGAASARLRTASCTRRCTMQPIATMPRLELAARAWPAAWPASLAATLGYGRAGLALVARAIGSALLLVRQRRCSRRRAGRRAARGL
ncbi:hypothetical protein [Kouleothrix sp.]|uniref:hypothetical protein n=1 Tax=Kouleothrix sp. TaxID=2779161 RepID=UPI00391DF75C